MTRHTNLLLQTDSYKASHHRFYPEGTTAVYSYFESRKGARFDETVFFGLQAIIREHLTGVRVTEEAIAEAKAFCAIHFHSDKVFNEAGWRHILTEHGGKLPIRIKAVAEGTVVPVNNVMMTVENTDPTCYWLSNYVETLLTRVWYPSTVATLSRAVKKLIASYLERTADSADGLEFMLQDFGARGATTEAAAEIGGAAHLINFKGSDTMAAALFLVQEYAADLSDLSFSVPASEHSTATALGPDGEIAQTQRILDAYPEGIISSVGDSYDIYRYVTEYVGQTFRQQILDRNGTFVIRPDSVTPEHPEPAAETVWILQRLWKDFGGTTNSKGYRVLDSHVRVLWGDGIDIDGIGLILEAALQAGFSAENLVFGMGGGLLQRVTRDDLRFAFKCSAQRRDGVWEDVYKRPLSIEKASKRGRMALVYDERGALTTVDNNVCMTGDQLELVFENGELIRTENFADIRKRAALERDTAVLA